MTDYLSNFDLEFLFNYRLRPLSLEETRELRVPLFRASF